MYLELLISQSMITFQDKHKPFSYAKTQQIPGIDSSSTGFMVLQPGGVKPKRNTHANILSFVVITGKVEVTIYHTSAEVGVGTQFSVPPGNQYQLVNCGEVECRVFWVCLTPGVGYADATNALAAAKSVGDDESSEESQSSEEE
jgi:mannose-6-phosphate isomerase-like protein (cupin superfamily)